jgi:hypothetical protein
MQQNAGFAASFAGLVDYSSCYPIPSSAWLALGSVIAIGAFVSSVPQAIRIVALRSSLGLNLMYVMVTTFGQFILVPAMKGE